MKVTLLSILVTLISAVTMAQSSNEVKWAFSSKKIADKTYEVQMTATVNGGWHIYSQKVGVDGPIPTSFTFSKNPLVVLDGTVNEQGKVISKNEEVWGGVVKYYENKVVFVQKVKIKGGKTKLAGKVEYMVCNDEKCLPPAETEFSVAIGG
ncbi:protein-disulfide reductase DsbD domain-containing protein [Niastella sp. OAS944]|uniref:protein-disulfide reductase DsbD domain-containing protein n=1 Tax=Niastella sp. OAS944 TaxID=2664089 RepID=UPI003497A9B8|nr:thiol:disulfide interchange protein DsbD [Chitinophagaceae bacterium OAS944]